MPSPRLLSAAAVAAALAIPASADAAYTSAALVGPPRVQMTGDMGGDQLILHVNVAGDLEHNRFSEGDPGFASATDFTTGDGAAVTTRNAGAGVTVNADEGSDGLQLRGPLNQYTSSILFNGGPGTDALTLVDPNTPANLTILPGTIEGGGGGLLAFTNTEAVSLFASKLDDRIVVPGPAGVTVAIRTSDGDDTVVLGDHATLTLLDTGAGNDTYDVSAQTGALAVDLGATESFSAYLTSAGASPDTGSAHTGTAKLVYERSSGTAWMFATATTTAGQLLGSRVGLGAPGTLDGSAETVADTGADPTWTCAATCNRAIPALPFAPLAELRAGNAFFLVETNSGHIRGAFVASEFIGTASGLEEVSGLENVLGGSGDDTLIGSPVANRLDGNAGDDLLAGTEGADTLDGGAGRDTLTGGDGDDTITAADGGTIDQVRCGAGVDTVAADDVDAVDADCENVARTVTQPAAPASGPAERVVVERAQLLTNATFAGVFLQTRKGKPAKSGARIAVARNGSALTLVGVCHSDTPCRFTHGLLGAKGTLVVPAGEARTATVRLSRKARRRLARAKRRRLVATLTTHVTDGSGHARQDTATFTLAGPKPKRRR